MNADGPVPGLALIVGATPGRAILTDGMLHWRFPAPPDMGSAPFRPGETLAAWCARLWPGGLASGALTLLVEAVAEGAFSAPPPARSPCLRPVPLPPTPEAHGPWRVWRAGSLAWAAPAADPAAMRALSERLAQRLSIRAALRGPHRLHWLAAPPPLPELPALAQGIWATNGGHWRQLAGDDLWSARAIADAAFGLLHRLREQRTPRGWLAEAQMYPPPGRLRPGRWPPQSGCCGVAQDRDTAWAKAAHEAAERSLCTAGPAAGSAAHPDSAEARRRAGWEAVERQALAAFWRAPGRPCWHCVPGSAGRLFWTRLRSAAGMAVMVARRDGAVIGSAAASTRRAALAAARDEIAAMEQGGARLSPGDARKLRGLIAGGRSGPSPPPLVQPASLPPAVRARDVTPRGVTLRIAVAAPAAPAPRAFPRWQI